MSLTADTFLTPRYVAEEVLKIAEKTLANWRSTGHGPPFTKVGKKILYPSALLNEWMDVNTRRFHADQAAKRTMALPILGERESTPVQRNWSPPNATGPPRLALRLMRRRLVLQGKEQLLKLQIVPFEDAARNFLNWADTEYREHPASGKRIRTSFASLLEYFGKAAVTTITVGRIEDYKAWRRRVHQIREITLSSRPARAFDVLSLRRKAQLDPR